MDKIVVANLYRLGKDGDKFSKTFKTRVRSKAKIGEDYVKKCNANWKTSGQIYEIDEVATKERDEEIALSKNKKLMVQFNKVEITRDELKEKADGLGITYPKNIKTDKLFELIKASE